MIRFVQYHALDLGKGAIGVTSGVFGVIVTRLDAIEQWLRICASAGATIVAIATFCSIVKKWGK